MAALATRRQVLRWGLIGGAAAVLPASTLVGCGEDDSAVRTVTPTTAPAPTPTALPTFLTADELQILRAATARIIPTDDRPGALEAGAANYIDRLLAVVPDESSPTGMVFGGGPFSGRTPFPDSTTGTPSANFPPDEFAVFVPLTRLQLLSWRVRMLGSAAVPGSNFNGDTLPAVTGWRDQYRTGLAALQSTSQQMFMADFVTLTPAQQDQVIAAVDGTFRDLVTQHTLEGMFSAPEYGGNSGTVGWQLIGYDGDSQPLGYSIFNTATMSYDERSDKPNSTANPGEDFSGVDADTQKLLAGLVKLVGGPHFP